MKLISSILTVAILVAQADRKPNIVFILADENEIWLR